MSGCVVLSEDDLLRLTEAGLSGDRERFLTELRDVGMPPLLISLAKRQVGPADDDSLFEDFERVSDMAAEAADEARRVVSRARRTPGARMSLR